MSNISNSTATLNQLLWEAQKTTPQDLTFWAILGVLLSSLILSSIVTLTIRYFELYSQSDPIIVRFAIGTGTIIGVGLLGLECSAVYNLIQHAAMDYSSIIKQDTYILVTLIFVTSFYALPAWIFYAYRSWKLLGRNYIFLAFTLPVAVLPVALVFVLSVYGFQCPQVSLANLEAIGKWNGAIEKWNKVAAIAAMINDGWLCLAMIVGLQRSKRSFLHMEKSLFTRLTRLAFETMLPPAILLLMTISSLSVETGTASNFRRTALSAFPLAYYHCLLYCLVTRQTVREMMDDRLAADGVGMLSNSDDGRRGPDRGGVYVSTTQHVHTDDSASKASEQSSGTEVFALSSLARDLKGDWAAPV